MGQKFEIVLVLTTECKEVVDSAKVACWIEAQFHGCDMGDIKIKGVRIVEREKEEVKYESRSKI